MFKDARVDLDSQSARILDSVQREPNFIMTENDRQVRNTCDGPPTIMH